MSKAISVSKAKTYFKKDFANQASISYYSANHAQLGRWHGELATELGLIGVVNEKQFGRLAEGRDPNAKYDPEDLKGWLKQKDGSYTLRDQQHREVARVWQEGRYWHRSDSEGVYSTALSAQKAAHYEAIGQLIEHRNTVKQQTGEEMAHRAGHDIVFNWHKSISLTAVHDPRIYEIEQRAVKAGLAAMQQYAMVHGGGNEGARQTAKWAVATFQHTTARPEKVEIAPGVTIDYSAPHLHTHAFWLNLARDEDGQFRAVEPERMFRAQNFGAAVAAAEMAADLKKLGYDVQQDKSTQTHAPMIAGYTEEYLKAQSPRAEKIKAKTAELGYRSRRAEEIVAHQYRNNKLNKPPEAIQADHLRRGAQYGNQHQEVLEEAMQRVRSPQQERTWDAATALTHAKDTLSIRKDVFTEMELLTKALHIGQGYVRIGELREELGKRSQSNSDFENSVPREFMQARHAMEPNEPGMSWTTSAAKDKERQVITLTLDGQNTVESVLPPGVTVEEIEKRFASLNQGQGISREQAQAVYEITTTRDQVYGLTGVAGSGKTSSVLAPVRALYEEAGFEVVGLGPTGKARGELETADLRHTMTLQKFLHVTERHLTQKGIDPAKPRLYIVDELSMVSSASDLELLQRVRQSKRPQDRILEAGDTRQHESVEAGRIFEEQMEAGMRFSSVTNVRRQRTEDYREVVRWFQVEKPHRALSKLEEMGCVTETPVVEDRQRALARRYAQDPERTAAGSPFNQTRQELNEVIRDELQKAGQLGANTIRNATIYVQRGDLTSADLKLAMNYSIGDVLTFHKNVTTKDAAGQPQTIEHGQYGEVVRRNTDPKRQWLDVSLYGERRTVRYDPMDIHKVSVYEKQQRDWAVGEKITLKKPFRGLENGDTLTITHAEANGNVVTKHHKSNRTIAFNVKDNPHLEYGYVSTSYSIQGATARTILADLPTSEKGASAAFTNALGYVLVSRGQEEIALFTDDLRRAMTLLSNNKVKDKALSGEEIAEYVRRPLEAESKPEVSWRPAASETQRSRVAV